MVLERYRAKRDFKATPEPRGRVHRRAGEALSFVVQKHAARSLHYDFRLEWNGVLWSWAIPKGPSLDPADKRLAMHVEDHPIEYGDFEGVIPKGQYGGGTVLVWDRGTWIPEGDAGAAYGKGELKFVLEGEKLHGRWVLVRTRGGRYGDRGKEAWLLIKERDTFAQPGMNGRIVDEHPDSVISGRSLDEIARERTNVWNSNKSVAANIEAGAITPRTSNRADRSSAKKKAAASPKANAAASPKTKPAASPKEDAAASAKQAVSGAVAAAMPASLAPQLATLVDAVPAGDDWLHEAKYDGYRMLCRIDDGEARLYSRNGNDWTGAVPKVAAACARLPVENAWLDGEVTVVGDDGRTSFQLLQNALGDPTLGKPIYFVFDLLYVNGYDLRSVPLRDRKRLLRMLMSKARAPLHYADDVQGDGKAFFDQACKSGIEGVVAKRATSLYRSGVRTREWVKVRCGQRQEMVIGGFTEPRGSRSGLGALLLGVYERGGALRYSGKVGTGFDDRTLKALREKLGSLERHASPFANPPRGYAAKGVHWVKPTLVAEIAFTEWTNDGTLRHPVFHGLRVDKNATEVVRERPVARRAGKKR